MKLFEIGSVWKGGKEEIMAGIVTEKEKAQEEPLSMHAPKEAPTSYEDLPLSTAERFKPFSKYPYIVRDIAMWVPAGTSDSLVYAQISDLLGIYALNLSITLRLFDHFEKQGKMSLAYRITFQSLEKTLTEIEVNEIMDKVSTALKAQGFEIR